MSSTKTPPRKLWLFVSVLCLVPAVLIIGIWLRVMNTTSNVEIRKGDFVSYFPAFMQEGFIIKGLVLVCCIAAIIFGSRSFNQPIVALRIISMITVLIAVLIALAALFSM
jgi:hypothetical protein